MVLSGAESVCNGDIVHVAAEQDVDPCSTENIWRIRKAVYFDPQLVMQAITDREVLSRHDEYGNTTISILRLFLDYP